MNQISQSCASLITEISDVTKYITENESNLYLGWDVDFSKCHGCTVGQHNSRQMTQALNNSNARADLTEGGLFQPNN